MKILKLGPIQKRSNMEVSLLHFEALIQPWGYLKSRKPCSKIEYFPTKICSAFLFLQRMKNTVMYSNFFEKCKKNFCIPKFFFCNVWKKCHVFFGSISSAFRSRLLQSIKYSTSFCPRKNYRFPSLFAVDTFRHFGPQILIPR